MTTIADILTRYEKFSIPRLDLEILLATILDCSRSRFYSHPEEKISASCIKKLNKLAKERKNGKPIAYLVNCKEFYGLSFYVDERTLIPRPETEMIIDEVDFEPRTVLDIATGSGAIGLTLAHKFGKSKVTLIDICPAALEVAQKNAENLRINSRVELLESDLLEKIAPNSEFDLITVNLPYIGEETYNYVSPETLKFEPSKALFAGKDGLDLYRKLFAQIIDKKIKFKRFIGEFGFGQSELIGAELAKYFDNFEIKTDLSGIPRIFIVK